MENKELSLGDRMNKYEKNAHVYLDKNKWTVFRLDGRCFSKFTKPFKRPFDDDFISCMNNAAIQVFKSITGIKYGYTQSDEVSFIMKPTATEESELPFGGRTDKLLSLCSSSFTGEFIRQLIVANLFSVSDIYMIEHYQNLIVDISK